MLETEIINLDAFLLEEAVWIATIPIGVTNYDFPFDELFSCRRPVSRPNPINVICRTGAFQNYPATYAKLLATGIKLIHSPEQHSHASELISWYPLLSNLTPRSYWFEKPPSATEIEQLLGWPLFLKGNRQTSKHQANLSIINSAADYCRAIELYEQDPILRWQPLVCREYIELRPIKSTPTEKIPPSFEFRTFWWHSHCVGAGPYWQEADKYSWTPYEREAALRIAQEAANRMQVPFLVIDLAQTKAGNWIVIECNDAQESGYSGVSPFALWNNVIAAMKTESRA